MKQATEILSQILSQFKNPSTRMTYCMFSRPEQYVQWLMQQSNTEVCTLAAQSPHLNMHSDWMSSVNKITFLFLHFIPSFAHSCIVKMQFI